MKKQRSNQKKKREIKIFKEYSRERVVSNEDLVIEILLHVPAKSLIRFKCVSKLWLSLISDPNFSSNHARRNFNSLVTGFYFYYKTLGLKSSFRLRSISLLDKNQSLPNFKFLVPKVGNLNMVDACNGLILFSQGAGYTVCNPTTRKYTKILPFCVVKKPKRNGKAWLAFDPSVSNQYKIIRLVHIDSSDVHEINIYSSKNSSWKRISITIENIDELENSSQAYWNKALNWVTKDHFHIRFDVEKEKLTSTPLGQITENHIIEHLGSCHGNLILVTCNPRLESDVDWSTRLTILEMKSNNNSWVVKCFKINIHQYSFERIIGLYSYVVKIANGNNGDEALLLFNQNRHRYVNGWLVGGDPTNIVSFSSNSKTSQELDHLPFGEIRGPIFDFFETLSPV